MTPAGIDAPNESAPQVADDIIDWYWTHGRTRQGEYAVSPVWLRRLYQRRDLLRTIANGRAQTKASLGLWGPSQSGKSTLISQFVDQGANPEGEGSSLDWGTPVLFSGRDNVPGNVVVFNPHNIGADASGCVSRFVLAHEDQVRYLDFPVEIQLLSPSQLLHAISAGYASECQCHDDWTIDRLEELLTNLKPNTTAVSVDRNAFEYLHEVIEVIDRLIEAREQRFTGLNVRGQWTSLANRIIESDTLLSSKLAAQQLGATLLWDNQPALNRLYDRLLTTCAQLPVARLFCTMEVAAVLVNIESYRIFLSDANEETLPTGARRIRTVVRHLSCNMHEGDAQIGTCFADHKLLHQDQYFGLLQGIVRELVIPIRAQALNTSDDPASPFIRVMSTAEIVDFPGVPWRDKNADEALLNLANLPKSDDPRLLTELLKRGKVRSLINDYSHTLGIDAFILFAKAGSYVPKVEQLHRGLVTWWKCVDPSFDVYSRAGSETPLPLFFNMTFFANIVNKFSEGAILTGYHPLTEMIKQLDPFVQPGVSTLLTTTYPHFIREGKVALPDRALAAVDSILRDHSFGPRCKNPVTQESLREMVSNVDGGVGYLFKIVASTICTDKRQRLLDQRYSRALIDVRGLVEEQSPLEASAQCRKDITAVKDAIDTALSEKQYDSTVRDSAAWISYRLRTLLDVTAAALDPLPVAGQNSQKYEEYMRRQINKWISSKASHTGLSDLGLDDPALRTRLLGMISQRVDVREFARWIMNEVPKMHTSEDNWELRRILAVRLSNGLTRTADSLRPHPDLDGSNGVIAAIQRWADAEDNDQDCSDVRASPHFTYVIAPICAMLDELANGGQVVRPPQNGDDQSLILGARLQALLH